MNDSKGSFNIIASIELHVKALKPLLPRQAVVGIGEYPIKTLLKEPSINNEGIISIFIEKSSDDIYKWIPKAYETHHVLGFEDKNIDTHFWYNVLPAITKDTSIICSLKKGTTTKLHGAILFASIWDGIGSAALPAIIKKFKKQGIDTLSIVVTPSAIQPADAHFNAYATMQMCLATEGSTVLLLGRDQLESFEGVNREGEPIKGNLVVDYILDLLFEKELLVQEIAELSRTFNMKLFSAVTVASASYQVYGSIENMLNAALLKPLSDFDISNAALLYVLVRMPTNLKDKLPRVKLDLAITNWFKSKTNPQSIHITEPIYTKDETDRIDAVLFIGGFDTTKMFSELEEKVAPLKKKAIEMGYMTEDWQLPFKVEEPESPQLLPVEEIRDIAASKVPITIQDAGSSIDSNAVETKSIEPLQPPTNAETNKEKTKKTKRIRKPKREQATQSRKPKSTSRTRKKRALQTAE
jgi:cell division GTPase FtsZ